MQQIRLNIIYSDVILSSQNVIYQLIPKFSYGALGSEGPYHKGPTTVTQLTSGKIIRSSFLSFTFTASTVNCSASPKVKSTKIKRFTKNPSQLWLTANFLSLRSGNINIK